MHANTSPLQEVGRGEEIEEGFGDIRGSPPPPPLHLGAFHCIALQCIANKHNLLQFGRTNRTCIDANLSTPF